MTRGTYERTPEIRERNRLSAKPPGPCPDGCTCGRHEGRGGAKPCPDGCSCGKHQRSAEHNARIGMSVKNSIAARGLSEHPSTVKRREQRRNR